MMKTKPGSPTTYFSGWTVATLVCLFALSGCDSNGNDNIDTNGIETEFHVRYLVVGSCDFATAVGFTLNGGGDTADSIVLPWAVELDIDAPTPSTSIVLWAKCAGRGGNNSITAKIFVDGIERGSQTDSGTGDLHVNVGVTLN